MHVLISSPEVDNITHYLRAWCKRLVKENKGNHTFFHTDGRKANRKHVCGILCKKPVDLVLLNGHGTSDAMMDTNNEIMICVDDAELLNGKVTHALACSTAQGLGKKAMQAGAKGYIGYDKRFVMLSRTRYISHPLDDDVANLFLGPAFSAPKALLNGKTCDEAVSIAKIAYQRSIKEALNSDIQSDKDRCVGFLLWDLKHLKSCGKDESHTTVN